ncbi:MAG TPA: S8 family serine peptidase [Caldilineaceae bacterium]|nr:S8 family serine peptidase [Caldilineaceae bacterium]
MGSRAEPFHYTMPGDEMEPPLPPPVNTGRLLILFDDDATEAGMRMLSNAAGLRVSMADDDMVSVMEELQSDTSAHALVYAGLGVAVINADPDQMAAVSAASTQSDSPILTTEMETTVELDPIMGVQQLDGEAAWGLDVTGVLQSQYSGAGIKVAILDTGFDLAHPDFVDRNITSQSFVTGQFVQDSHGHGTHCTGTACGPIAPTNSAQRYGIAYAADIYIGKVLGNNGSGSDISILAGIDWAIREGCHIISLSIGGLVSKGASYSDIYETAAARALDQGVLLVAAAGNNSFRDRKPAIINPVSRPANCPSILAVAAVDNQDKIARFSNGGINVDLEGSAVDIAGPGVNIYSSWPSSKKDYNTISGTSMATPHVAGIAALYAQADARARGRTLWDRLTSAVRSLNGLTARDVGAGLVRAP